MGYIEATLMPGETIAHRSRVHGIVLVGPAIASGLLVLGAGVLYLSNPLLGAFTGVLAAIAVISLLAAIVKRNTTELAVTNRRVIAKVGVISRRTLEMNVGKVENVGIEQGIWGRMNGYGSVVVTGSGGTKERFDVIADPIKFKGAVQMQSNPETAPPAPAPTRATTALSDDALDLQEELVTKFAVRTTEGAEKIFTLRSSKPGDVQRALEKLRAQGCTVIDIKSA